MRVMSDENIRNEAFERFFANRNKNTITEAFKIVANEINVSESTIRSWCYKYNWNDMVDRKQETMLSNVQAQVEEIITTEVKTFCNGIMVLIKNFIDRINNKEVEIKSIKEFNDLISSYAKLQGLIGSRLPNSKDDKNNVSIVVVNNIPRPTGEQTSNRHVIDIPADSEAEPSAYL